jgi:hypothetical protein
MVLGYLLVLDAEMRTAAAAAAVETTVVDSADGIHTAEEEEEHTPEHPIAGNTPAPVGTVVVDTAAAVVGEQEE